MVLVLSSTSSSDRAIVAGRGAQTRARRLALRGIAAALGTFIAVQGTAVILIEAGIVHRDPVYAAGLARLRARLAAARDPELVVLLGSSRLQHGVVGSTLERRLRSAWGRPVIVFTFARSGGGPVTELVLLERLWRDGLRPSVLVVEAATMLFADTSAGPVEMHWLPVRTLARRERAGLASRGVADLRLDVPQWVDGWVPAYSLRVAILSRLSPPWAALVGNLERWPALNEFGTPYGVPFEPRSEAERDAGVQRTRRGYSWLPELRLGRRASRAVRALLDGAAAQGAPTILVRTPESSRARSWYPPAASEIDGFLQDVSAAYRAPVIDAREWIPDDEFVDGDHPATVGAARFTERLGDALAAALPSRAQRRAPRDAGASARAGIGR